jgi:Secretion system C-terminal sorting domain
MFYFVRLFTLTIYSGLFFNFTILQSLPPQSINKTNTHTVIFEKAKTTVLPGSANSTQLKTNEFTLTILADFNIAYIWIYNEFGYEFFKGEEDSSLEVSIPKGLYYIFLGGEISQQEQFVINKENIFVFSDSTIKISKNEARIKTTYILTTADLDTIRLNTFSFYFFNSIIKKSLRTSTVNFDSKEFILFHNDFLPHISGEWAAKGKQNANNGNLYLISNKVDFPSEDTVINNNTKNLVFADFIYNFPDSILSIPSKQLLTFYPDFHSYGINDPFFKLEMVQRIYQDTSLNTSFKSSKFFEKVNADIFQYYTPEIRIGKDKVYMYPHRDSTSKGFILSETNEVQVGVVPTFWYGKFFNDAGNITIKSPFGQWQYLFLSLSNDLLNHYPFKYTLFSNGEWYDTIDVELLYGPQAFFLGFNPENLTFPVISDKYKFVISDYPNEVAGIPSLTKVTAEFDLRENDKNPPNILSFQIISNNTLTNILNPDKENQVRLIADDDYAIQEPKVYFKMVDDSVWNPTSIYLKNGYYSLRLPTLNEGYYSLKTILQDSSNNFLEMLMEPAFYVYTPSIIRSALVKDNKLKLLNTFPNPFNSTIAIRFYIPELNPPKISLDIYNVNGQFIKSLLNGPAKSGKNTIIWNSSKSKNQLSSGLYFIVLKGGEKIQTKKILLIK